MQGKKSERRLAENQVVFRDYNERAQRGFDELNEIAREEGQRLHGFDTNESLHFYCECSDETCQERILLSLDSYNEIHISRDTFMVVCGHEIPSVEHVVATQPTYCIVKKYKNPPQSAEGLNLTTLHNS